MKRARFVVLLVLYAVLPVSPPAVEAHHDAADVLKQDMRSSGRTMSSGRATTSSLRLLISRMLKSRRIA